MTQSLCGVPQNISKMYVIVRKDLSIAQQAVQACHAMTQFQMEFPLLTKVWFETSNTLAMLCVPNEVALDTLVHKAQVRGINIACFREPDRGLELTAITIGPDGKGLTRGLPLALM